MQKHINDHYKCTDLMQENEYERILFEYDNPYGYNLGSNSKRTIDYENMINCPRNSVNRDLLAKKR